MATFVDVDMPLPCALYNRHSASIPVLIISERGEVGPDSGRGKLRYQTALQIRLEIPFPAQQGDVPLATSHLQ